MDANLAQDPKLLAHYEGLVLKTAVLIERVVEEDFDDICQFLRYKVWRALLSFDPARLKTKPTSQRHLEELRDKYVFSCVQNGKKDALKKKKHHLLLIDDMTTASKDIHRSGETGHHGPSIESFEEQYLSTSGAYEIVEEELPVIPSTLTEPEKAVLLLLYLDFKTAEIAARTLRSRKEINAIVRSIKTKMADWSPTAGPGVIPLAISQDERISA